MSERAANEKRIGKRSNASKLKKKKTEPEMVQQTHHIEIGAGQSLQKCVYSGKRTQATKRERKK